MLSGSTCTEIGRVTVKALQKMSGQEVIELVTIIHGYEQLLEMYPDRPGYVDKLAKAVSDLTNLAERRSRVRLVEELRAVSRSIDLERQVSLKLRKSSKICDTSLSLS